jgi:hypothetical protein
VQILRNLHGKSGPSTSSRCGAGGRGGGPGTLVSSLNCDLARRAPCQAGAADLKASPLPPAPFTVARAVLSAVSETFGDLGRSLVFCLCSLGDLCESLGVPCESLGVPCESFGVLWGSLWVLGDPLGVPLESLGVPWSVLGVRGCGGRPKYQFCAVKVRFWEALGIKMSVLLSKSKLWVWSGGQNAIFA